MKQNYQTICDAIARACDEADRDPAAITVIAVTKMRKADQIKEAMDLGLTHFGENRVQEAAEKWPGLKQEGLSLHLIGPLQSNKVKQAKDLFDVLHTLDRMALWEEMQKHNWRPPCFVQVNTGEEAQKSGVLPKDLSAFMTTLSLGEREVICGLMCIPPVDDNPSLHFAFLAKLAREQGLSKLSMGMSDDFEAAIRCGATHIRLGSALFD